MAERRFDDVSKALARPFRRHGLLIVVAFAVAALAVRLVGGVAPREVAILVGAAILVGSIAGYWAWFSQSRYAPGVEALGDHNLLERRSWRRATGSRMPRTRSGAIRWLADNPPTEWNAIRRLRLQLATDDVAGARTTLDGVQPETADERFSVELDRATIAILGGGMADLAPVREAASRLTDATEHRHARVCYALLEARYAVAVGSDPWLPILAARADLLAERRDRLGERERGAHRPLGIVLMRSRVAEIDENSVAHILGDKAIEAADHHRNVFVVLADHLAQVFRIEL
jgi:hypothetical protein